MLKKLIKHEFKDTMRLFIPMFGFIVVLTPIDDVFGLTTV